MEAEGDVAASPAFDRARVDLAVGEVLVAVGRDPLAAAHTHGQVRVLGHDPQLELSRQGLGDGTQPSREATPAGDGVAVVEEPGAVNEVLVLRQRHLRILGGRVRRVGAQHPAQLAAHLPLEVPVAKLRV